MDSVSRLARVTSGDAEVATGSWFNISTSVAWGVPVSVIGGTGLVDTEASNPGVMVSEGFGITDLAGLKSKAIGVKTGCDLPVPRGLGSAGIDIDDVKEVGSPRAGMRAARERGIVDAVDPVGFC